MSQTKHLRVKRERHLRLLPRGELCNAVAQSPSARMRRSWRDAVMRLASRKARAA
jgi:hypothetical protein